MKWLILSAFVVPFKSISQQMPIAMIGEWAFDTSPMCISLSINDSFMVFNVSECNTSFRSSYLKGVPVLTKDSIRVHAWHPDRHAGKYRLSIAYQLEPDGRLRLTNPDSDPMYFRRVSNKRPLILPFQQNDWRRDGDMFACMGYANQPVPNCYNLAGYTLDMKRETIAGGLGVPLTQTMKHPSGWDGFVYILEQDTSHYAYFIIYTEPNTNRTMGLQLTGLYTTKQMEFSGVRLGDYAAYVTTRFGKPYHVKAVPEVDAEQWSYMPYLFSFEIKNDRLFSIFMTR